MWQKATLLFEPQPHNQGVYAKKILLKCWASHRAPSNCTYVEKKCKYTGLSSSFVQPFHARCFSAIQCKLEFEIHSKSSKLGKMMSLFLKSKSQVILKILMTVAVVVLVTSCGGGGGGGETTPNTPPATGTNPTTPPGTGDTPTLTQYVISGSISVLSTGAVDSDTNDPFQAYVANDTFAQAQSLPNPVLLSGHLNVKGQGNDGPNKTIGDLADTYKVTLQAGQTIEIDFAADPTLFDIDLLLFNSQQTLVGQSIGTNRYECIRVTQAGTYFIGVDVFADTSINDSVYQLRISAPGGGSANCVQASAASSSIVAGEIIAEPKAQMISSLSKNGSMSGSSAALGLSLKAGQPEATRPTLYSPPASAGERTSRMSAMQKSTQTQTITTKGTPSSTGYKRRSDIGMDAASVEILDTIAYAKLMQHSGQFVYAVPNRRVQSLQTSQTVGTLPSNDPQYSRQRWHYDMISLPLAMQTLVAMSPQPTRRPIVAVVDTGIVSNHPDLAGNIIGGYDFVRDATRSGDGDGIDNNPDESVPANNNPSFHGAHVAGTVAAQGFNGVGGVGVAPMARIMPLRVLGVGGSGTLYDIAQAIRYAAGLSNDSRTLPAERADVINLSLGGDGACSAADQQLYNQVRAQGTIVVAASGNESRANFLTPVGTPANCTGVISVGSVDARRSRAFYSNGGPNLAIVAPGGDVSVSTTGNGQPDGVFSTVAQFDANGTRQPTYSYLMGTSMATPHMAGVVALMRWVNPAISPDTVDALIRNGSITEDLGAPGRDSLYGYGLINAKRAVDAAIASRGGGGSPPPVVQGRIEASPAALDMGSVRSEAELLVQRIGATTETVASVTASTNAISVAPRAGAVDANKLGTYLITANRNNIAVGQSVFSNVIITTNSGRAITITVALSRFEGGLASGSLGVIYVLALDADGQNPSLAIVGQGIALQPVNGRYSYTVNVAPTNGARVPSQIAIVAGSDLDNDGKICNRGEACGAYPLIDSTVTPIVPTRDTVTDIDFSISPFGGITPSSLSSGASPSPSLAFPGPLRVTKPR